MRKITALAVLITVIGTASFASSGPLGDNSNFKVLTKADSKFELIYVSSEEGDVSVTIYDNDGKNISSSTVKDATKFRRTYDFSQLEAGKYSVVVRNEEGIAREEIAHKLTTQKLQTFVAKLPDSKAFKVHVGDFDSKRPVNVKIYNSQNKVIHREAISNTQAFSKVFNLDKVESGDYTVLIENNGELKTFTHTLK